ncbi:MAG: hypothetical protein R3266_11935 [Gemmatimonadota bacterium]|nr:hypothetical protein [Gemmatimonadota bacterium]
MRKHLFPSLNALVLIGLLPLAADAQQSDDAKIQEALAAGPPGVAADATVLDWPAEQGGEFRVLREGSNGWTCLPDQPGDPKDNFEPMCNDAVWMDWLKAMLAGEEPRVVEVGLSYMLNSRWATSNVDPGATEPRSGNEWVEGGAHLMMVVPDPTMLDHYPDDPSPDHPYVMWKGTPFVHVMIPMEDVVAEEGS